jgi:response regulator RpfG family c-di-GMP phosphodiesterase
MADSQFNILLVDDDLYVIKLYSRLLYSANYNSFHYQDARKALVFLSETKVQIDLIVADVNMPGMSGIQFLQKVKMKPSCASIPFLFFSAVAEDKVKIEAFKGGAIVFIQKPVDNNVFIANIDALVKSYASNDLNKNVLIEGSSDHWQLEDIISYCEKEKIDGFVHLINKTKKAVIFLDNGVMEDVKFDSFTGVDAYEQIEKWESYNFLAARGRYIPEIVDEFFKKDQSNEKMNNYLVT